LPVFGTGYHIRKFFRGKGMKNVSQINRGFKARIRLHYTWYLAVILITVIVVNQFPMLYQLWQRIALGLATSLIFFLIIGIRQIIINFVASRRNVPLNNVILFVFGGIPQLSRVDNLPVLEGFMGVTGILLSLVLAIILYFVHMVLVIAGSVIAAGLFQWLAFITMMLTFFHIIPGFPLDGGRILNSLLWKKTGDYYRSVKLTAWIGWTAGISLIVIGIILVTINQQWFTGITLAFVGLSLEQAAAQSRNQASLRNNIQNIPAYQIMSKEYPLISSQISAGQLVRDYIMVKAYRYFIVADNDGFQGIISINDIKSIPKKKWEYISVAEVMTPAVQVKTANIDKPGDSMLEQMEKWGIEQMPVLDGVQLAGVVAREDLLRLSRGRSELKV
jgi:Zn-dependent protease